MSEWWEWLPAIAGWTFLGVVLVACILAIGYCFMHEDSNRWEDW